MENCRQIAAEDQGLATHSDEPVPRKTSTVWAVFYHGGDHQCLEQPILVSRSQIIDMDKIESWSIRGGMKAEFDEYKCLLMKR